MSRSVRRIGCRQVVKVDVRVQVRLTTSVECLNRSATWEAGRSERHGLFDNLRFFEILELELNLGLLPPPAPRFSIKLLIYVAEIVTYTQLVWDRECVFCL